MLSGDRFAALRADQAAALLEHVDRLRVEIHSTDGLTELRLRLDGTLVAESPAENARLHTLAAELVDRFEMLTAGRRPKGGEHDDLP
jgi:hypothetical protein